MRLAYGEKPVEDGNIVYYVGLAHPIHLEMPRHILDPWKVVMAMDARRLLSLGLFCSYDGPSGHYIIQERGEERTCGVAR